MQETPVKNSKRQYHENLHTYEHTTNNQLMFIL